MTSSSGRIFALSLLRRFHLVDAQNRRARLFDLKIAQQEDADNSALKTTQSATSEDEFDHPPVTHILFHDAEKKLRALEWKEVESVERKAKEIRVRDIEAGVVTNPESLAKDVLLERDVLDAMILDLENRRATRANDLLLKEIDGQLRLEAVDTGFGAIIRRLTRGKYMGLRGAQHISDWKHVEFLRGDAADAHAGAGYNRRIARLPPGEIATLSNLLPYLHAAELLTLLPDPLAADTLEAMSPERQLQIFEELDEAQGLQLLTLMAPDNAADLIGRLQPQNAKRFLERLPQPQRDRLIELLRYPETTVGGIMTNDVAFLPENITVAEARARLREVFQSSDFVYLIYFVADTESRRLRGVVSLRQLVVSDDNCALKQIMDPYVSTLHALSSANEAAYRVISSHLAAMPVVGDDRRLLGVVTVDAAVAQVAPATWSAQAPRVFT